MDNLSITEPSIQELDSIYQLIKPHTRVTPLIKVESLSELIEGKVWIKPESLQKTGAFKFRGALYRLMTLSKEAKKQGVTAYSSGNFARGLATAGKLLNISVNLVMPHDAPENKIISARQQGATVTLCSSQTPSREEAASLMAAKIAKEQQQTLLHPFDDLTLIKGQASVAVELKQQLSEAEIQCQQILCPVGGGSLVAGTSMVFKNNTQITAVEAEGYAGMQLSLAHQLQSRAKGDALCECDALQALEPGKENLDIALRNRVNSLVVSAPAVRQAMKLAFDELKLVLEPSGAISLAAIIEKPELFRHTTLTVIATGGNVDHGTFASALTE